MRLLLFHSNVLNREATYAYDAERARVNRGDIVPAGDFAALPLPCFGEGCRIYLYQLQPLTRIMDLTKLLVLACIAGRSADGIDHRVSLAILLLLSTMMLLVTRFSKPYLNRMDMALGLVLEGVDVSVYGCMSSIVYSLENDMNPSNSVINLSFLTTKSVF